MDIEKLEEQLRMSAAGHTEEVDTTALWTAVSANLHKKKRRRFVFWIFLGVLGLTTVGGAVWSLLPSSELVKVAANQVDPTPFDAPVAEEKLIALAELDSNDDLITSKARDRDASLGQHVDYSTEIIDRTKVFLENPPSFGGGGDSKEGLESQTQNIILYEHKADIADGGSNKLKSVQPSILEIEAPHDDIHLTRKSRIGHPTTMTASPLQLLTVVYQLPMVPQRHRSFFDQRKKWTIGILGDAYLNNASITAVSTDPTPADPEVRSGMTALTSFGASLHLGYHVNDRLSISSGFSLLQFYGRSTSELTSSEEVLLDGVVIEQVTGPNGTTDILGEAMVTQVTRSVRARIARFSTISIPLGLEYALRDEGFVPYVGIGLDYSFSMGHKGFVHVSENVEYDISTDTEKWLSGPLGLAGSITLGGKWPVSERVSLRTSLGYRKEFFSRFSEASGLSENYNSIRLGLGLDFQF